VAIEGPLRELGIHDVFQLLDLSRKTGELRITSELRHNQGQVYFEAGAVVYAEIKSNPHPLGRLLVRSGKIDEADLTRARETQVRGDRRRLGQILVASGVLTERELTRHVRAQVEEVIFELMNWREGYFSFVEGPIHDVPADTLVRIPTEALLMEAARRIDEWSRIERKIPHLGVVPALAPDPGGAEGTLDLLPPEWEVLAVIDGRSDLRAIAAFLARSEFDTAKIVFGLEAAGVLQIREGGPGAGSDAHGAVDVAEVTRAVEEALGSGDPEGARARVEGALASGADDPRLHVLLARARLATGRAADAEDALRRALVLDPQLAEAQRLLGAALAQRGRFAEAVEWWSRWLAQGDQAPAGGAERERVSHAMKAAQELDMALRQATGG
jgi:hypothetical protein